MGTVIFPPLPMLAEDKKLKTGKYRCQICENVVVVDEHGVVEDLELVALRDKESMFGPDSLSDDEKALLEEVKM